MKKNTRQEHNQIPFDKVYSTFRQEIYLANGIVLTGYSKRINRVERNNRAHLLSNWILRSLRDGYLDEKNSSKTELDHILYTNNLTNEPLLRLWYSSHEWLCIKDDQTLALPQIKYLTQFLNRFYTLKRAGKTPDYILKELYVNTKTKSINYLSVDQPRFLTEEDLVNYTLMLLETKDIPAGEIEAFFLQYREKYFNKGLPAINTQSLVEKFKIK